jgi:hypothetical protein
MHVGSAALANESKLLAAISSNFIESTMQKRMCAAHKDSKTPEPFQTVETMDVSLHQLRSLVSVERPQR